MDRQPTHTRSDDGRIKLSNCPRRCTSDVHDMRVQLGHQKRRSTRSVINCNWGLCWNDDLLSRFQFHRYFLGRRMMLRSGTMIYLLTHEDPVDSFDIGAGNGGLCCPCW